MKIQIKHHQTIDILEDRGYFYAPRPPLGKEGKVARNAVGDTIKWPRMTAAQFERLPGHEKTAVYFTTSASRIWQARWHNDFLSAFEWFSQQLSIRERRVTFFS